MSGASRFVVSDEVMARIAASDLEDLSPANWRASIHRYDERCKTSEMITDSHGHEFPADSPALEVNGEGVNL